MLSLPAPDVCRGGYVSQRDMRMVVRIVANRVTRLWN